MAKDSKLTAAMLELTSDYAGRLEDERKFLVNKLNHAESVIHDLTGDKELLKSELERSRDMANYSHGQLYSMNEYCIKNGFDFVQNNPALTMIHEMEKMRSERDALVAKLSMVIAAWNGYDYEAINAEINKAPQQCLAEIKAEAGRAGYLQALADTEHRIDGYYATTEEEDNTAADEYAEKIRKREL